MISKPVGMIPRNTLTDDERNEIMFAYEQGMYYDEQRKDENMNILNEMRA